MSFPPGPKAAYQNVPIMAQYYQPSRFVISAITLGSVTTITTTQNVNYLVGQQVRLIIPPTFGCRQLNEQQALVIDVPELNQVVININSKTYDPYIASSATTQAQIMAIGDVNSGQINAQGPNFQSLDIPASFINISPI
jgi:hypothetical protein